MSAPDIWAYRAQLVKAAIAAAAAAEREAALAEAQRIRAEFVGARPSA